MPFIIKNGLYLKSNRNEWSKFICDAKVYRIKPHAISGYKNRYIKDCEVVEVKITEVEINA